MAGILKVCHIRNPTKSVDAHLLEEQSSQMSSRFEFDMKRWIIALF